MLVLIDRGFDAGGLPGRGRRHAGPVPGPAERHPPPAGPGAACADGSFLSRIGGLTGPDHRRAEVTVTCADGTRYGGSYRLATTLLDHRRYPAAALIRLYHERWEHEIAYLALRHTLLQGRVLRSGDPAGLEQEMWALLALYQALRIAIVDRRRDHPRHRPRPGQLHHRPANRQRHRHRRRGVITSGPPDLAGSAAPSWPACTRPAGPASAPARSNPRSAAGTKPTPHRPARSTTITAIERHVCSTRRT